MEKSSQDVDPLSSVEKARLGVEPFSSFEKLLSKGQRNRELESEQDSQLVRERILSEQRYSWLLWKESWSCAAQSRLSEAQSDLDRRVEIAKCWYCSLWNLDVAPTPRMELYQAHQLSDQLQREKGLSSEEIEMRNRAFQEDRAGDCQEIEEIRRICCAESDRARQLKYDEPPRKRKIIPLQWISLWFKLRNFKTKWTLWLMQKNLMILKLRAALDCPRSLSTHEYSESLRNDEPWFPRNSLRYFRKLWRRSICSRWTSRSTVRQIKEFDFVFLQIEATCYRQHCGTERRSDTRTAEIYKIPTPHFASTLSIWNPLYCTGGIGSKKSWKTRGMKSRTCISISSPTHVLTQDVLNHNVVDQRRGGGQISGWSYDFAVSRRAWLPWFWNAWCKDNF